MESFALRLTFFNSTVRFSIHTTAVVALIRGSRAPSPVTRKHDSKILGKYHGLRLGGFDSHPHLFTLAPNHPSAHRKSLSDEARSTTSSAKCRGAIVRPAYSSTSISRC